MRRVLRYLAERLSSSASRRVDTPFDVEDLPFERVVAPALRRLAEAQPPYIEGVTAMQANYPVVITGLTERGWSAAEAAGDPVDAAPDLTRGVTAVRTDKPIFLSHAFADRALADLLRDALVLGGVSERRIFYSSDRGSGVPTGEDVGAYLLRSLQGAGLVIELVSETFLTRPMCLMELGGAWALGTPTYPIAVPPLTRNKAIKQIGNVQMGELGTDTEIGDIFDELHDRLAQDLGIQTKTTAWSRSIANFRQQLPSKLVIAQAAAAAAPAPPQVAAVATPSAAGGERITIGNISVVIGTRGRELHAEATNHDIVEHSVTIKATFYGADTTIVGTADSLVSQLRAGGTKTFTMSRIPDHARAKVEVDTIF